MGKLNRLIWNLRSNKKCSATGCGKRYSDEDLDKIEELLRTIG